MKIIRKNVYCSLLPFLSSPPNTHTHKENLEAKIKEKEKEMHKFVMQNVNKLAFVNQYGIALMLRVSLLTY